MYLYRVHDKGKPAARRGRKAAGLALNLGRRRPGYRRDGRLGDTEARYERIAANAPGMFYQFVMRPDGSVGFPYVSEGSRELYGLEPRDVCRDAALVVDTIHPDDRPGFDRSVAASAATLSPWKWEGRFVLRSGEQKWLRGASRPELRPNGDILWDGLLMDVTERKRTEEALAESERRLRAVLVQYGSDVIAILEADGTFRYESPAVEVVLGYGPGGRVGESVFSYIHPDDLEVARSVFGESLRGAGSRRPAEIRFRHADGSWRWLEGAANNLLSDPDVRGIVANFRDVTERKALEGRLAHQATHDALTGLPNRALFSERAARALARARGRGGLVAVLLVDLDNFKYVNDTLGHGAGDGLLVAVAGRLRGCLRPRDTVARFGGDEFAVLLEDASGEGEAERVAGRIIGGLGEPFAVGGREVFVTPSIGVALDRPGRTTLEDLLRRADLALYEAKGAGKARHAVFDPAMEARVVERLELENDLRRAASDPDAEFAVRYQPIVRLGDAGGRPVVGFEALLRWKHPGRGLLSPSEFLPLAEELGLTVPIGRWLVGEACRQTEELQRRYPHAAPLAVGANLSVRQLSDPGLVSDVIGAVRGAGLDPGQVILEVTEDAVIGDAGRHLNTLRGLKEAGFLLALDDFGTGYSSLSYLRRLPVRLVKIDRSFVEGIGEDGHEEDEALLSGIVEIAHGLGLLVCAEGVEGERQLGRAEEMGCDLAQGHLFSEPLGAKEASAFLAGGLPG